MTSLFTISPASAHHPTTPNEQALAQALAARRRGWLVTTSAYRMDRLIMVCFVARRQDGDREKRHAFSFDPDDASGPYSRELLAFVSTLE